MPRSTLRPSRSHSHTRYAPPISARPARTNSDSDAITTSGLIRAITSEVRDGSAWYHPLRAQAVSREGLGAHRRGPAGGRRRLGRVSGLAANRPRRAIAHDPAALHRTEDDVHRGRRGAARQRGARRGPHRAIRQVDARGRERKRPRPARRAARRGRQLGARPARGQRDHRGVGTRYVLASDPARTDVLAGATTFPSFAFGPADKGARIALIALPWNYDPATPIQIRATDEAGNTATRGIPAEIRPRKFPKDTIDVKDAFLQAKVPELLPQRAPSQPLTEGFLVINRDLRRQAEETKRRIGATTADKPLWQGPFLQPRNTKVFANFAELRTYVYGGREIDRQVHYGYDLASTRQSPVPAANKGVVVFAEPLTIYGNTVVVDHGLGLQTLYAHLSSTAVKAGDAVEKGQELARTGSTGLAIGDHLHYEVLVNGVSVTPLEWWDAKWIRNHIGKPLKEAGLPEISGAEARDEEPASRPATRATRRRGR